MTPVLRECVEKLLITLTHPHPVTPLSPSLGYPEYQPPKDLYQKVPLVFLSSLCFSFLFLALWVLM